MAESIKDRAERAIAECRLIATMTEEPGRTTRRFLTPPVRDVHEHLRQRMEALSMSVRIDGAGNLRGVWQPHDRGARRLLLGSHIDTVPDAGAFDGVLGVAVALEWVQLAQEKNLPLSIEVIAFSEEEGVRFGVPFLGSRAVAGRFDPALFTLKDADGITLDEAIRTFGLEPAAIVDAVIEPDVIGFIEVHIEQGPVLEAEGLCVAAVTGIVGQTRLTMELIGRANHAGTTPMHLRNDALAAAAEWIGAVESIASKTDGLVATVGKVMVEPNAANVIPGRVRATLDIRHARDEQRNAAAEELLDAGQKAADRRGLSVASTRLFDQSSVPMDERLTAFVVDAIEAAGLPAKSMPSGAGHDAMVMANRVPTAMLFVRSPGGVSHHPSETVRTEDVEAALEVGRKLIERLAAESHF